VEKILAYGHKNVKAKHKTTIEFTKDRDLTPKGDCIIAVSANKALNDLNIKFKEEIRKKGAKLVIFIKVGELYDVINAFGDSKLTLTHSKDVVIRKSKYICSRTLAINADKAAFDLKKELIEKLKDPSQKVEIILRIKS
jgi:hypothetical protein